MNGEFCEEHGHPLDDEPCPDCFDEAAYTQARRFQRGTDSYDDRWNPICEDPPERGER